MSDEMEIMREFAERLGSGDFMPKGEETMISLDMVMEFMPDAVKREICRAFKRLKTRLCGRTTRQVDFITEKDIDEYIAEYSPAPQYCEGMQEAIDSGYIKKHNDIFSLVHHTRDTVYHFARCPFCKEGKDCLKNT